MRRLSEQTTICGVCDYILSIINDLSHIKINEYEDLPELEKEVRFWADDIYEAVEKIRKQSKKIENRLEEYRDAIEQLGFVKNKEAKW